MPITETLLKSIKNWINNYNNEPKYDDIKTCIDLRDNAYELFLEIGNSLEDSIIIPVYYSVIGGKIFIDEDSIREEFEIKLKKVGKK